MNLETFMPLLITMPLVIKSKTQKVLYSMHLEVMHFEVLLYVIMKKMEGNWKKNNCTGSHKVGKTWFTQFNSATRCTYLLSLNPLYLQPPMENVCESPCFRC